eukprot:361612-Chlamydomonas_euryale.AAC.21
MEVSHICKGSEPSSVGKRDRWLIRVSSYSIHSPPKQGSTSNRQLALVSCTASMFVPACRIVRAWEHSMPPTCAPIIRSHAAGGYRETWEY